MKQHKPQKEYQKKKSENTGLPLAEKKILIQGKWFFKLYPNKRQMLIKHLSGTGKA